MWQRLNMGGKDCVYRTFTRIGWPPCYESERLHDGHLDKLKSLAGFLIFRLNPSSWKLLDFSMDEAHESESKQYWICWLAGFPNSLRYAILFPPFVRDTSRMQFGIATAVGRRFQMPMRLMRI